MWLNLKGVSTFLPAVAMGNKFSYFDALPFWTILMGHDYAPSVRAIESNWNGKAGSATDSNSRYMFDSFLVHLNPFEPFLTTSRNIQIFPANRIGVQDAYSPFLLIVFVRAGRAK